MDRELLMKIIEDYQVISDVVNKRLAELKTMLLGKAEVGSPHNIRDEIEKQRAEVASQIDKVRADVMAQARKAVANTTVGAGNMSQSMPNMPDMPKMPNIPADIPYKKVIK
jgi:hypothetical protein